MRETSNRVKRMQFQPFAFEHFFKGRYLHEVVENALPADATITDMHFDASRRLWWIYVESAEFEELEFGKFIPELPTPVFKSYAREELCQPGNQ